MWRTFGIILGVLTLAGCMSQPVKQPEKVYITVTKYIDIPEELLVPCPVGEAQEQTAAEAKRLALLRKLIIVECDHADKEKIRKLNEANK